MRRLDFSNITVKRPERDDWIDLAPAIAVIITWALFTSRSERTAKTMLIPAVVGITLWITLKGVRYAPR